MPQNPGFFPPLPKAPIEVTIQGGNSFPYITQTDTVPYHPGITARQALAETGQVRFNSLGQVVSVSGIYVGGKVDYTLVINGRPVPHAYLSYPLSPGDRVLISLTYQSPDVPPIVF